MTAPALRWQVALAFVLSLLFLCGLIGWLQNVHMVTANGMYKSLQAEPWIADFAHARLDPSNYLYFPLYGASASLLDAVGILRGVAWKQFAYLNAFWASIAVAAVYGFAHRLTADARTAALAALFHLGCGFVLLLGVINEDIMPAYTLVLGSMLLAGLWFAQPTGRRVAVVAAMFTLGWLVEWRLIFPTLSALVLALAIADVPPRHRAAFIVLLLVSVVATAGIVELAWEGHNGAVGLHDLLWTGKGIDSGWAGITWGKAWMMLAGVGGYLFTLGTLATPIEAERVALPLALSVLVQLVVFAACVAMNWRRGADPRIRAVAAVFLGTLAAGQVLNCYAQPHDPQLQINVMPWLTVAWLLLLDAARARRTAFAVLAALSVVPLAINLATFSQWRGADADAIAAVSTIERRLPPQSTAFIYWGFEYVTVWQYVLWGRTWDWGARTVTPPAASSNDPTFKWIALNAGAIRHRRWSPGEHVRSLESDIDLAFRLGYRVVISDVWTWSVDELTGRLEGLAAADRAPAIHAMLHGRYEATRLFDVPTVGTYYELRPRKL